MLRFLKVLFVALILVALGVFLMSCGSGGNAQVRVINAIDASINPTVDVYVNTDKEFPSVPFGTVYPTQGKPGEAAYVSVPSGKDTFQAYDAGTTSDPFFGNNGDTLTISGPSDYTMVLGGQSSSVNLYQFTDNNTVPTEGNFEVRVINASNVSAANGVGIGVSVYQSAQTTIPPPTTVAFGQASSYMTIPFVSAQYYIEVFYGGTQLPIFKYAFTPGGSGSAGEIDTFVIVDNGNGSNTINPNPIRMIDLN